MIQPNAIGWAYAFEHGHELDSVREYPDGTVFVTLEGFEGDPEMPTGPCVEYRPQLPERLAWINSELEEQGWPAMSQWWITHLGRYYFSNWIARNKLLTPKRQRRECWWRVGRRGGKSSTICRVAVFECIFNDDHNVPPGDTGVFAIISAEKPQAKERVNTIKAICDALDIKGKPYAESYEFAEKNRAIRCFTASITSVVSFTCIGALCDEMAIWRDSDTGLNPAADVLKSLKPTIATMPNASLHFISAPWSTLDEHFKGCERGNTPAQMFFEAPTWVANDGFITEEETYLLEPDEPSRLRAYGAVPLAADEEKFFNAALIDIAHKQGATWEQVA